MVSHAGSLSFPRGVTNSFLTKLVSSLHQMLWSRKHLTLIMVKCFPSCLYRCDVDCRVQFRVLQGPMSSHVSDTDNPAGLQTVTGGLHAGKQNLYLEYASILMNINHFSFGARAVQGDQLLSMVLHPRTSVCLWLTG